MKMIGITIFSFVFLFLLAINVQGAIQDNAVLIMPLNNVSGYDNSTFKNNLTAISFDGDEVVSGVVGNAIKLDGVNDEFNRTTTASLDSLTIVDTVTLSGWFKVGNQVSGSGSYLISNRGSAPALIYDFVANTYEFYTTGSGIREQITSVVENDGWQHIAVTYNKTHIIGYRNGTQVSFAYDNSGIPSGTVSVFALGSFAEASANYFNGTMDEVYIWNRTLTPQEVADVYNNNSANCTLTTTGWSCPSVAGGVANFNVTLNYPLDNNATYTTADSVVHNITAYWEFLTADNCSIWTNRTGSWTQQTINTTAITNNTPYTFAGQTYSTPANFSWMARCYDNNSAIYNSSIRNLNISQSPTDTNSTNLNITMIDSSCTTGNVIQFNSSYTCIGQGNCSGTYYVTSPTCTFQAGNSTGDYNFLNYTNQSIYTNFSCSVSTSHTFHFNTTDSDANASVDVTCSAAAGAGLTADESSCLLTGEYTNGTICATGEVRRQMGSLSITLFILLVTGTLFAFSFKKDFSENKYVNLIAKRGCLVVSIMLMALNSAIMMTIASNAGLPLTREMRMFLFLFGWGAYASAAFMVLKTGLDIADVRKQDKYSQRME